MKHFSMAFVFLILAATAAPAAPQAPVTADDAAFVLSLAGETPAPLLLTFPPTESECLAITNNCLRQRCFCEVLCGGYPVEYPCYTGHPTRWTEGCFC
jgi:hypothetical protein